MQTFDTIEDLPTGAARVPRRSPYNTTWLIQRHGFVHTRRLPAETASTAALRFKIRVKSGHKAAGALREPAW